METQTKKTHATLRMRLSFIVVMTFFFSGIIIGGIFTDGFFPQTITHTKYVPTPCIETRAWTVSNLGYPTYVFQNASGVWVKPMQYPDLIKLTNQTSLPAIYNVQVYANISFNQFKGAPVCQTLGYYTNDTNTVISWAKLVPLT